MPAWSVGVCVTDLVRRRENEDERYVFTQLYDLLAIQLVLLCILLRQTDRMFKLLSFLECTFHTTDILQHIVGGANVRVTKGGSRYREEEFGWGKRSGKMIVVEALLKGKQRLCVISVTYLRLLRKLHMLIIIFYVASYGS